jgi:membrane protease YdiL (CAAX protease family)
MSRITFLDNAEEGKNNWLRYLLTIILTWGTPFVLEFILIMFISTVYMIATRTDPTDQFNAIISDPILAIAIVGLSSVVSVLFLYVGVRFIHERKFTTLFNTGSKIRWKRILKGAGIWFTILMAGTLISLILYPGSVQVTFNPNTFIFLLILSLLVFPIQASFEELFFRGYLMQGFGLLTKKPVIPLLLTSVIFASLHYGNGSTNIMNVDIVLSVFIFGLTMGIITLGENGLETAMGVHIINNIFVSVLVNTPDAYSQGLPSLLTSTGNPDPMTDVPIFALYALVLLVLVFWNKMDKLYNIFRGKIDTEIDKMEGDLNA